MAAFRTWKGWVVALFSAVINGIASGVVLVVAAPETFNVHAGLGKLLNTSLALGIYSAANFLKKSPLPRIAAEQIEEETTFIEGNGPGKKVLNVAWGFLQLGGLVAGLCWFVS